MTKLKTTAGAFLVIGGLSIGMFTFSTNSTHAATSVSSVPQITSNTTNQLQLDQAGPVEHYIWNHEGQKDEVWHDSSKGYWRIVKTFLDGSVQKDIFTNGFLYITSYDSNNNLIDAQQIAEPATFTGKDSAFDGLMVSDNTNATSSTLNNIKVNVFQKMNKLGNQSSKLYVDSIHHLPLKAEHTINGVTTTETWSYDYQQTDNSLFTLPPVSFKRMPSSDTVVSGK
ncbi:MAG: hypothetical protein ACXVP2_04440 [Tumebacillaceae bacterium]